MDRNRQEQRARSTTQPASASGRAEHTHWQPSDENVIACTRIFQHLNTNTTCKHVRKVVCACVCVCTRVVEKGGGLIAELHLLMSPKFEREREREIGCSQQPPPVRQVVRM